MVVNLLFTIKERIFTLLVGRNPAIKKEYQDFIQHRGRQSTCVTLWKILRWIAKYGISPSVFQKKISKLPYPETAYISIWQKELLHLQEQALNTDIVSMDLFGVMLIFPFSEPDGLFLLLGQKWGIPNFKNLRIQAQRELTMRSEKSQEKILLTDIYDLLEIWCAVPADEGVQEEKKLVRELCFVNPEIKKVYDALKAAGKKIMFMDNTYFTSDDLTLMLDEKGVTGYEKVFASNECDFKLRNDIEEYFGEKPSFFYITCQKDNNFISTNDIEWNSGYYPPLNSRGEKYRPYDMNPNLKCIYDGICNSWLYSGQEKRSIFYEYGFTCGGILAVSICQWLDRMAKQHEFDQILFVARDGDVISKVYKKFFDHVDNHYLLMSRMALEQLVFLDFTEEYLDHVVLPELREAVQSETIGSLFEHIGIKDIKKYWEREGFFWEAPAVSIEYKEIRKFIYKYKRELGNIFENAVRGAKNYFHEIIGTNQNICVFDIGWRGTSAVYLKHLFEKDYQLPVHVTGALLGGGAEDYADPFFMDDSILAFAFSRFKNSEIMKEICQSQEHILATELLFTSDSPSLLTYGISLEGTTAFEFEKENPQAESIREIHRGILDYAEQYFNILGDYAHRLRIHSLDAVSPLMTVLRNRKYVQKLIVDSKKRANARHGF